MKKYNNITEIKKDNKEMGHHFFSPESMRFFNSVVRAQVIGDNFFVTGERFEEGIPWRWTVRQCVNGAINTVSEFQEFETVGQALGAAYFHASKTKEEASA
jgi:hypothetical protein